MKNWNLPGGFRRRAAYQFGMRKGSGLPVQVPSVDLAEIGAGGGSRARIERGILRVGPESAGADPGPACYGLGGSEPTVTDAACPHPRTDPTEGTAYPTRLDGASSGHGCADPAKGLAHRYDVV